MSLPIETRARYPDHAMADIDPDRLIFIVVGVQLKAELGDRPLGYRVEVEVRKRLAELLPPPEPGKLPRLAPAVISDVFYLNHAEVQSRPAIAIGGPGMNMLSANLVEQLPTAMAIENVLVIQMDLELADLRCAVWGMDHLATVRAVETFIVKGYLDAFVNGVVAAEAKAP
jgi:hypothetical protein